MLVHGTEKGSMACLENPGTEGAAQIGNELADLYREILAK